jgi:hypothetical protein
MARFDIELSDDAAPAVQGPRMRENSCCYAMRVLVGTVGLKLEQTEGVMATDSGPDSTGWETARRWLLFM